MHVWTIPILLLTCYIFPSDSLDNGLALTPPMGWLSWERFRCLVDCETYPNECISEALFKRTANTLVKDGYLSAGYEYIIIDDCWAEKTRDENGRLQADHERFPNGIAALAEYVHKLGLKLGIYGDYGNYTCAGYPGSLGYLEVDAQTFAEWGVDYLKLDGCYVEENTMEEGYVQMSQYLNATGRPIVFSCSFPAYQGIRANYSLAVEYCNLWRNYDDIDDQWDDVIDITNWFVANEYILRKFSGPGHWNDPDMLIIGNFGLSLEQSKSQMTIWSMLAAPLIMSVDLDTIRQEFKDILLNKYAISINQDPLGYSGLVLSQTDNIMVWYKKLQGTLDAQGLAVGIVSKRVDGYYYPVNITISSIVTDTPEQYNVIDVFDETSELNRDILKDENITVRVPPSGAVLLLMTPL